ncbi:MAG: hypothetical protein LBK13_11765 [Spirochaetales bacterium]|nr:hypothetical protein [Spirochaetales bacterium]
MEKTLQPSIISDVQVYNPEGTPFTGNIGPIYSTIYNYNHAEYNEVVLEDASSLGVVGNISAGKLTLNLPAIADSKLFSWENGVKGADSRFSLDSGTEPILSDLSLQKAGLREIFAIWYCSDTYPSKGVVKGWNFVVGQFIAESGPLFHFKRTAPPSQWFSDQGYRWVYNPNPLAGTWERTYSEGSTYHYEEIIFNDYNTYILYMDHPASWHR